MSAADCLRRKADDYRALGQEHASLYSTRVVFETIALVLLEVAAAIEAEEVEKAA